MQDQRGLSAEKRESILNAAIAEFLEKGFHEGRMDCISARASVSKRTVYKHFESKEALFHAIAELLSERVMDSLDVRYDPEAPIRDQLIKLGWAEGRLFLSEEVIALFRMIISEAMREPELAAGLQGKFDKTRSVSALLSAAAEDGKLRIENSHAGAEQFIAMLKARAFWPPIFGEQMVSEAEMSTIIHDTVEMMMARYGADEG